jgi:hypothetical protein
MSEIKFACPHCAQHVACDSDYADMCIVCPGCSKPMLVPIMNATDAAHPKLVLVAATPAPRQTFCSRIPALDPWTEEEWKEHASAKAGEPPGRTPLWIVSSLGTIILAAVLRANGAGAPAIIVTVVVGSLLSGYLARKAGGGSVGDALVADANLVGRMLLTALAVMLAIPLIALGVLFVGCGGCQ